MRNKKILSAARDCSCQWCGRMDGTTVAAHSNQLRHGKGMGIKASDQYVAFLCFSCHHELDQGRSLSKEQRQLLWQSAHEKTKQLLIGMGLLEAND